MITAIQDILTIDCILHETYTWEIKAIIEKYDALKEYLNSYNFNASYTVDTLADYFIVTKICSWNLNKNADDSNKYLEVKEFFESVRVKYEKKKIVEFLKTFSFHTDDEKRFGFTTRLYDMLPQFAKDIKDENMWCRAINAHPYLILNKFMNYNNLFKRYTNLYDVLFSDDHIESFIERAFETFAKVAANICKTSEDNELKDRIINKFICLADKIIHNTDLKCAPINQMKYTIILRFLNVIKYPDYAEYYENKNIVDDLVDKWLQQNGKPISLEIPIERIRKEMNDTTIPYGIKFLMLTHSKDKGKWEHFVVQAMECGRNSFTELFASASIPTNKHFGAITQQLINLNHICSCIELQYLVSDEEKWKVFSRFTLGLIDYIYQYNNLDAQNLYDEFYAWTFKGAEYFFKHNITDIQRKDIVFTFIDKTIKLTEKILRDIYYAAMKNERKYFDPEKLLLKGILNYNDPSNPMLKLISVEVMQYLLFCLTTDKDENENEVGIALRNLFEHNKYNWKDFKEGYAELAIIVLISVLNEIYINYILRENRN